jgi:hypothetical protein
MMKKIDFDFGGYATRANIKCTDGRVIKKDAFKHQDGQVVPLVWQHVHTDPANVLGKAYLEHRADGVYAYCKFNNTDGGKNSKIMVEHGDITALSIHANQLQQAGSDVLHGYIREVSLVLAGANPGALIDNLNIKHSDGSYEESEDEAIIYSGLEIEHALADEDKEEEYEDGPEDEIEDEDEDEYEDEDGEDDLDVNHADANEETIQDVFDTLSEKQKNVVYAMMAELVSQYEGEGEDTEMNQSEGGDGMKKNVFEGGAINETDRKKLTHAQIGEIMSTAKKCGSLKEAMLTHIQTYGIENIDYLFPDAKSLMGEPDLVKRQMDWVPLVLNGARHSPFSRIKSMAADITAEDARAKGYVKEGLKKEEVISLLKRVTTPTTIYKKQKLDRDDIIDITDLDVVAFLKAEMRLMLDEEIARAALVGDGRDPASDDKISETNIRPIYKDADTYAHKVQIEAGKDTEDIIEAMIRGREFYEGKGVPTLFTTTSFMMDMLLLKDNMGRRLYPTVADLAAMLMVDRIVQVPVMIGQTREVEGTTYNLLGIIVNINDYVMGADKGGNISMFDDFDIDYNQYKYLMETRMSGALIHPKSALIIEQEVAG